jgi:hypothetical protein
MVSPVLAQAILGGGQVPDLVGQFQAGQQQAQLQRSQEAAQAVATRQFGTELGEVAATDPAAAAQLAQALNIPVGETARLESFAKDIQIANSLAASDPETGPKQAIEFVLKRRNKLNDLGIETPTIDEFLQTASFDPDKALDDLDIVTQAVEAAGIVKPAEAGKFQFGAQQTFKDEEGNLFFGTTRRSPTGGEVVSQLSPIGGGAEKPVGQVSLASRLGETAAEQTKRKVDEARDAAQAKAKVALKTEGAIEGTKAAAKQAIKTSGEAFNRLEKIGVGMANIDEAIDLIDQGARTGVVASKLPSVRAASIQLDNLQGRLGLDVIGNTTFGALSESELKFALDTALPKNLKGEDLKKWLVRKREAQQKLSGHLTEVATFLGTPGNTVADWLELQKVRRLDAESAPAAPAAPAQSAAPEAGQGLSGLSDAELQELLEQTPQ